MDCHDSHKETARTASIVVIALSSVAIAASAVDGTFFSSLAPSASESNNFATGVVRCADGKPVSGIWVDSNNKESGRAAMQAEPDGPSVVGYSRAIGAATSYVLHIGCGDNNGNWEELGYTPAGETLEANAAVGLECPNPMKASPVHNECRVAALEPFGQSDGFASPVAP